MKLVFATSNQNKPNTALRKYASDFFSLNKGVDTYYTIFDFIIKE